MRGYWKMTRNNLKDGSADSDTATTFTLGIDSGDLSDIRESSKVSRAATSYRNLVAWTSLLLMGR